jgi:solute carrier family 12 sodium/potassium/chloride transporter 2
LRLVLTRLFQDPASAIPKGTFLALVMSFITYAIFVFFAGFSAIRDASGNVTELLNGTISDCVPDCKYGIFNNYQVRASFPPVKISLRGSVYRKE